jgi:hypothetical protein
MSNINTSTNAQRETAAQNIDSVFDHFHDNIGNLELTDQENALLGANSLGMNIINYISDVFTVYTLQLGYNYLINNAEYKNISNMKSGDIFIISQYISTTWGNTTDLGGFYDSVKTLFRISINKNNRNWLFLNRYSSIPREAEILLRRGSQFIIKNIDTTIINFNGARNEIKVVDLELLNNDNIIENISKIYNYSGTSNYYDNPLKSFLFVQSAEYIYQHHLRVAYSDPPLVRTLVTTDCSGNKMFKDENLIINIRTGPNNYQHTLNRPNHGLSHTIRVCGAIYYFALLLLKYDPTLANIITPKFLLQITTAGLFLISGRDSEMGLNDQVNDCGLTQERTQYYNSSYLCILFII